MEISFYRFPHFNTHFSISANTETIKLTVKSLIKDISNEYRYDDLDEKITVGKTGDTDWLAISLIIFFIPPAINLALNIFPPELRHDSIAASVYLVIYFLSILAFTMMFFKEDWVWFYDKDGSVAFTIKIDNKNRKQAEALVEFIKSKIKEQNMSASKEKEQV